jgi:transmembrane sensor
MAQPDFPEAQRVIYLISRYIDGGIDFAELQELNNWRKAKPINEKLFQESINPEKHDQAVKEMQEYDTETSYNKVKQIIHSNTKQDKAIATLWRKVLIAASTAVLIGILAFLYFRNQTAHVTTVYKSEPQYIAAGTNKAKLTLANGEQINLDDSGNGIIAQQVSSRIQKITGGLISYKVGKATNDIAKPIAQNCIETPRGGQYQVVLSDGTKVWLNAISSLRYPVKFSGKERVVMLSGEAYFEVAHHAKFPFIVKTSTQVVKDIGTHFNINSYIDEQHTTTTLLEGAVQVSIANKKVLLKPGQQSLSRSDNLSVSAADVRTATAWKDGQLSFHRTDIKNVLRQISRWYDIEIQYEGKAPDFTITGGFSRQADLSAMLKILQLSDVHFVQQGRKLIILN